MVQTGKVHTASVVAELEAASKRYPSGRENPHGDILALDSVSLKIHAGEVLAVLGPNGAGKTTLINLLLGLVRPSSGRVRLFGTDPQWQASRARVGVMLQLSGVPATLRVGEHIESFRSYYPQPLSLKETLERSGLTGLEERLYGQLSGGQKQRLHLALALCGNPDLIFLDEPTTGLDVATRRLMWEGVRDFIRGGRTVVLSTHYLEEADALADRIILLNHGAIIAEGSPSEIKARTAGRRVRAVTRLNPAQLGEFPGVTSVRQDGAVTELLVTQAEPVVLAMLQQDPGLSDLDVMMAGLEDAFLALTRQPEAA